MIEAAMIWNEPNNKSHWDPEIDPDWALFAEMAICAGEAIAAENPALPRVLGGMSPIDPAFIANMTGRGVLDALDVVAVHGFPLDWNLWPIDEWPAKIDEIRAVTRHAGLGDARSASRSFGAEEVQDWGLQRTAELLIGRAPRIHWYSLYDLPRDLGGDDPPPRGGRLVLLPPLPHGPAARGRHAEAGARSISPSSRRRWGSASGSISRITGSTRRSPG